eukprot:TRINITY_DN6254_c0_g1_i1.p1 TRINITY_DN6254_c0_g1~~TRINITY_DN6254_c0_g1_i1.p1  ORF type:complete len:485 (-),score=46.47 TRINITY_DN6254_c0_g1_i1:1182-2636(-)
MMVEPRAQAARDRHLKQAIRRAAHFANFEEENEETENVHTGGNQARELGMFSTAYQLEQQREQATRARENRLGESTQQNIKTDFTANRKGKVVWKPARDPSEGPLPKRRRIVPLKSLTTSLVAQYIDCVHSLYGLPEGAVIDIGVEVCRRRMMTNESFQLFTQNQPDIVSLPNVSEVDQASMMLGLQDCLSKNLEVIELGFCGFGFGDKVSSLIAQKGPYDSLRRLSLRGGYKLKDNDIVMMLLQMPELEELTLVDCQLLEGNFLGNLPLTVKHLDVSGCRGITAENLELAFKQNKFEVLKLNRLNEVQDSLLKALVNDNDQLQELVIDYCTEVTDDGLITVVKKCKRLRCLNCSNVTKITNECLEAITENCLDLKELYLRNCWHLSDEEIAKLVSTIELEKLDVSKIRSVGSNTLGAVTINCKSSLTFLDVSFCQLIAECSLGKLVDSCRNLETLRVFGCSQLSNKFYWGHSNEKVNIIGEGL